MFKFKLFDVKFNTHIFPLILSYWQFNRRLSKSYILLSLYENENIILYIYRKSFSYFWKKLKLFMRIIYIPLLCILIFLYIFFFSCSIYTVNTHYANAYYYTVQKFKINGFEMKFRLVIQIFSYYLNLNIFCYYLLYILLRCSVLIRMYFI